MSEEFLHYIWKSIFPKKTLTTVSGEKITIISIGEHNRDAGPDFFNAMIRIGGTTWAGSVEIHVRSSDWMKHGHHHDKAYDNVVLHAVYEYDAPVYRTNGEEIITIIMKSQIPDRAYKAYLHFLNNHLWVPCANELSQVGAEVSQEYLEQLGAQRVNRKVSYIKNIIRETKGDWNQAFFISLAGSLGARINKEPFEMLARQTPVQIILKCRPQLTQLEALLFGQGGFLDRPSKEKYPESLTREYQHLKKKYSIHGIDSYLWKFLRLRPVNFPTIRIAQMAAIFHQCPLPFGMLVDERDPGKWQELFNVQVSEYWESHYQFGRLSARSEKRIGQETIHLIMINTVIPFLYAFGHLHANKLLVDLSLETIRGMPPEGNSIIRGFSTFGMEPNNALQSQGSLELKGHWCDERRCLDCRIGHELLKKAL